MADLTIKKDFLHELEKALSDDTLVDLLLTLYKLCTEYREEVIRLKALQEIHQNNISNSNSEEQSQKSPNPESQATE